MTQTITARWFGTRGKWLEYGRSIAWTLAQTFQGAATAARKLVRLVTEGARSKLARPNASKSDHDQPPKRTLRLAALVVPFLSIGLGVLSGTRGWFGPTIEQLSDQQNSGILIQPANGAFSIWGAIYPGVLGLAIVQASGRSVSNSNYGRARLPLVVNMLFNFAWFVATQRQEQLLSVALLLGQFLTALWLYLALNIPNVRGRGLERLLRTSVSIYLGWLTVASVISVAFALDVLNFSGWGLSATTWAIIMLLVSSTIGLLARFAWRDRVYGAVFIWAYVGVAVKAGQPQSVIVTAWLLTGVVLASLLPAVARRLQSGVLSEA